MEEKISVAEISRLRETAEEERKQHHAVMEKIEQQTAQHQGDLVSPSKRPKMGGFSDFSSW